MQKNNEDNQKSQQRQTNSYLSYLSGIYSRFSISTFFLGQDAWHQFTNDNLCRRFTQDSNELTKAVIAGQNNRIALLLSAYPPPRDKQLIQAVFTAVCHSQQSQLDLLLANAKVRACVMAHHNLESYAKETGDWGLLGKSFEWFGTPMSAPEESYENLLTHFLSYHYSAQNHSILNTLLAARLFDINRPAVNVTVTEVESTTTHHHRRFRPYERESHFNFDTQPRSTFHTTVEVKTPLAIACKRGCEQAVRRLLQENSLREDERTLRGLIVMSRHMKFPGVAASLEDYLNQQLTVKSLPSNPKK